MTAMQELVVPKSMPRTFAIKSYFNVVVCYVVYCKNNAICAEIENGVKYWENEGFFGSRQRARCANSAKMAHI